MSDQFVLRKMIRKDEVLSTGIRIAYASSPSRYDTMRRIELGKVCTEGGSRQDALTRLAGRQTLRYRKNRVKCHLLLTRDLWQHSANMAGSEVIYSATRSVGLSTCCKLRNLRNVALHVRQAWTTPLRLRDMSNRAKGETPREGSRMNREEGIGRGAIYK